MNSSLNKLRKKYIITASAIVLAVIILMIFTLNFLMRVTYKNEGKMMDSVIKQAAASHVNQPINEYFDLSDAEQTENGDFIIPRNVRDISNITVCGNIQYNNSSAVWYSAGGGLLFEAETEDGTKMVYKDYSFSRGTTNVSIDFESFDNIKSDYDILSIDESQIISDYFLVSIVWCKNSSNVPVGTDENIYLTIDSIEIHYKDQSTIAASGGSLIAHNSFSDIFENHVPEILNNTGAFYLVADSDKQLISINNGNLLKSIENDEAEEYANKALNSNKNTGNIEKDGIVYSYTVHNENGVNIIVFLNDSFTDTANINLLKVSIIVGIIIFIILFILIIIVSGYVIKPVADSMERQKQFLSNASHELKTPITVISATIDIIGNKNGKDLWTECIKAQAKKMQHLVTELLSLSKMLEVRTARSDFKQHNISSIVNNSLLYFESLLFESEKTLKQDIEDNILFNCDENKISQLISILMDNALKYSDEKSEIFFTMKKEKDSIVIICSNPCSSFASSDISKLFDRFFRSENDHTHEQEGFGLGLSIAQAIAELHKGRINASYNNNIVTFTVILNS